MSPELASFLGTVAWWVCVIGTYLVAKAKGRNRLGWTVLAVIVPLIALVIVAVLPSRLPEVRRPLAPPGLTDDQARLIEQRRQQR